MSPSTPLRPCGGGCPVLVRVGRCDKHGGPAAATRWQAPRRADVKRLRGRANQVRRARILARDPLCVRCLAAGRVTPSAIADHIENLAASGRDDRSVIDQELEGLCVDCHREKTQAEALRGRGANDKRG